MARGIKRIVFRWRKVSPATTPHYQHKTNTYPFLEHQMNAKKLILVYTKLCKPMRSAKQIFIPCVICWRKLIGTYKCTYNIMWHLSSNLLKKLKYVAAQFDCFRRKIKPIRAEIVPKQAYYLSLSLNKRNVKLHIKKQFRNKHFVWWMNPDLEIQSIVQIM